MLKNRYAFPEAAERYKLLFTGRPDEYHSVLRGGTWHICNKKGDLLGLIYPDGSVLSGRIAAELFRW